ncbi:hypothetical protein EYC84_001210 [Monilinia fructicola]|uniref:Uncharacterized protein n=1 Tax=Monilinia fructicola TaxID=38448 RepID=A0A5M9JLI9_MONFR|nr:hypothetical protein EYC84_001210 [Monilinia fructicola]
MILRPRKYHTNVFFSLFGLFIYVSFCCSRFGFLRWIAMNFMMFMMRANAKSLCDFMTSYEVGTGNGYEFLWT